MTVLAPLLSGHDAGSIVTWTEAGPLTAANFCGAAAAAASQLPALRYAINLCESGPLFMLASAAAWTRSQTAVLPSDRLPRTLERLRVDFAEAYCMCDTDAAAELARRLGFKTVMVSVAADACPQWPPSALPVAFEAACLHTSGSTGSPTRHRKTWGELVGGAATLSRAFGKTSQDCAILGTVAPQHMFGFETTIMFTLQGGGPLLPARPALPHDLAEAMRLARSLGMSRAWLFTTPMQLRAFHAVGKVDGIERVVTATMPLDAALASAVEQDWGVPVEEIYGCTEGGMLAHRRTVQAETFTPGFGIRFGVDGAGIAVATGGHLTCPIVLADRIEISQGSGDADSQRIRLLGRGDDLVKVAGKRASLAGLTATLKSIPGVVDGAFFLVSDAATRLSAAVVAPGRSAADVQRALAQAIDAAFLPRPLLLVDELPRGAGHKVSLAALRDLVGGAALTQCRASIDAEVSFDAGDPVFAGHFPGRPIVPGVLLLERVEAELAAHGYRVRALSAIKFHAVAGPGQQLRICIGLGDLPAARFEVTREADLIASGVCQCEELSTG